MKEYIIPFAIYIFTAPLLALAGIDPWIVYAAKFLLSVAAVAYFWKSYKIRWRLTPLSAATGIFIFAAWIGLEGFYTKIPGDLGLSPSSDAILVALRFAGSITAAPFIEETFVRSFLNRYIISKDWRNVPIQRFTILSFIATTAFFGLSHNRWLPGLITGAALNLLLMKEKDISSCISAHFIANLILGIFVVSTGSYQYW